MVGRSRRGRSRAGRRGRPRGRSPVVGTPSTPECASSPPLPSSIPPAPLVRFVCPGARAPSASAVSCSPSPAPSSSALVCYTPPAACPSAVASFSLAMLDASHCGASPAAAPPSPPPARPVASFSLSMLDESWSSARLLASEAARLSAAAVDLRARGHVSCARALETKSAAASSSLVTSCIDPCLVRGPIPVQAKSLRRLVRSSARLSAPRSGSAYESHFEPSFVLEPSSAELLRSLPEDYLAFISSLPTQLQVEEGPKVLAARRLAALMSDSQLCSVVGIADVEFASHGRDVAVGMFVATAARKWSSSYLIQLANLWIDVLKFSHSAGRPMVRGSFSGAFVHAYMARVEARARVQWLARHPDSSQAPLGAARGSTARGGAGSKLRTLASRLSFPVDVSSLGAQEATRRAKRVGQRKRSATERVQLKLERMAELAPAWCVRVRAAGFAAMGLEALRHASASRFALLRAPPPHPPPLPSSASESLRRYFASSGGTVHGVVLTDPKSSTSDGIPAVTSARGISGSRAWLDVLLAVQAECVTKSLVYDTALADGTPCGDPFVSSVILDSSSSLARSVQALHAILLSSVCLPSFTPEMLQGLKPHALKHLLASVSRNSLDLQQVTNEIGKWSGSSSQNEPLPLAGEVPLPRSDAPSSQPHITDVYSHEALGDGGSVAVVMELQIERIRRRIASLSSVDDLPAAGGFGYYATCE